MKHINAMQEINWFDKRPRYYLFGLTLMLFLWGCAVAPIKRLTIQDTDLSFEEGSIISTKLGKPVSFEELLADLNNCRIVYIGEKHTNVAHHRIQLEVMQAIFKNQPNLAVGMEMFDHTYQEVLDMWSAGELDQKDFLKKSHWYANWRFDFSLYREILEFIQENHIRLVALNIPSYIPPKIREGGIDNLRPEEKKHFPKQIDMSKTAHRDYLQNVFDGHKHHFRGEVEFENFYAAQSVWEDAMAEMISQHLENDVMVVLAGNGHIQFKYGIPDRAFSRTAVAFRTIYLAPVGDVVELDIADYIWVTP
ncbi:MAG: ChaN family lipoprotein [Desulfobacterales bacterium]